MCYNCGCLIPDDDMGDPKNITESTFMSLAKNKNVSLHEVKRDLYEKLSSSAKLENDYEAIFIDASKAWGQAIENAKKETKKLLSRQLR